MDNAPKVEVRFGDWIGEGWKMFTEQWKGWVKISLGFFLAVVVPIGVFIIAMYAVMLSAMVTQSHTRGAPPQMPIAIILFLYLGIFGLMIVLVPLSVLMVGGAYRAAFKQLRGGQVEFSDLFSARNCYWRLLGATLLHSLFVFLGMLVCIIPAFIVGGLLFFTLPLIIERDMGVFEAMRASREVTGRNLVMFTLFAIVAQLIASAGTYACYIGLLATWPLLFTMTAVAYRDCFGVEGALSFREPASSPPGGYAPAPSFYPQPAEAQSRACPTCHTSLPANAQFCYNCGTNLS
jgi:membrane-anchored glycerophosphoryl diester phosphodiesterase (GDPDase)